MATNRNRFRVLKCLAIWMVLSFASMCFGESVVIQVLSRKDGQPLSGKVVTMEFRYAKTAGRENQDIALNLRTDSNGEVEFQMPSARPEFLAVLVDLNPSGLHCSCRVLASTETVLREGLTVADRTRAANTSAPVQSAPGHILFVARPPTLLEKVIYGY
jgi:hypothetical protein